MDQKMAWIIGLGIAVGVMAVWRYRKGSESRKRFEQREELDLNAIYFWYFAHRGLPRDRVIELWCEVAESLSLPAGKLRPSDRFDGELAAVTGWGFDDPSGILTFVALQDEEFNNDPTANGFARFKHWAITSNTSVTWNCEVMETIKEKGKRVVETPLPTTNLSVDRVNLSTKINP